MRSFKQGLFLFFKQHSLITKAVAVFGIILISLWVGFISLLLPVDIGKNETLAFKINYGTSLQGVAGLLDNKKLIRSELAFKIFVRLDYSTRMVKAGCYNIGPGMSIPRIVHELHRGLPPEISVTIPEGLNIKELTDLLAAKGLVNPERFKAKLNDRQLVNGVLGDLAVSGSPEGYLFPDTYHFVLPTSEEQIIATMLRRFKEVYQQNFPRIPGSKRKQIVILASIVEEEAKKDAERPIIAGVFVNRLQKGDRLWSCATVQYALGTHKKKLYNKDLKVNSPYNTYLHYGLPPGPIANPGLASLKAAVNPARVSYLYFVARPDGSHIFSNTLQEHLKVTAEIQNQSFAR